MKAILKERRRIGLEYVGRKYNSEGNSYVKEVKPARKILDRCLQPLVPKQRKYRADQRTNAEKCRDYRLRLKAEDPSKFQDFKLKSNACAKKWRDNMSEEERQRQRERARQRQQQYRLRRKEMMKDLPSTPKPKPAKPAKHPKSPRLLENEADLIRERNRIRQARRRAKIKANPQQYEIEKKKEKEELLDEKVELKGCRHK
ncbi:hypothetical protein EGW08_010705 [Elysia chlorotica]|uniref:Uncharacterized protein n=1 Tax=Elysia chlorotica TaxID=188477 RepID=A0A3S1BDL6_ELYCH|nr:hypothetical protein EGW08_010705 [Elysia chlorotica]